MGSGGMAAQQVFSRHSEKFNRFVNVVTDYVNAFVSRRLQTQELIEALRPTIKNDRSDDAGDEIGDDGRAVASSIQEAQRGQDGSAVLDNFSASTSYNQVSFAVNWASDEHHGNGVSGMQCQLGYGRFDCARPTRVAISLV